METCYWDTPPPRFKREPAMKSVLSQHAISGTCCTFQAYAMFSLAAPVSGWTKQEPLELSAGVPETCSELHCTLSLLLPNSHCFLYRYQTYIMKAFPTYFCTFSPLSFTGIILANSLALLTPSWKVLPRRLTQYLFRCRKHWDIASSYTERNSRNHKVSQRM